MSAAAFVLAAVLSLAPMLVVGGFGVGGFGVGAALEHSLEGWSLVPLVALPWVALAGLPRGHRRDSMALLALALPLLALAARLDRADGVATRDLFTSAATGVAIAAMLAAAARLWPARAGHGIVWACVIALPVALELVLHEIARGRELGAAWTATWSAASPLGWLARRVTEPGGGAPPYAPLAFALVVLAAATAARARCRRESSERGGAA